MFIAIKLHGTIAVKVRDLINCGYHLLAQKTMPIDGNYFKAKDKVLNLLTGKLLALEKEILVAFGYDLRLDSPHLLLLNFCHALSLKPPSIQLAWTILHDR